PAAAPTMGRMAAPPRPWGRALVAGLIGCALFFAVGWVTAELLAPRSAPHLVLGAVVVDAAPPWLVSGAIELFGTADKAVLAAAVAVVVTRVAGSRRLLGEILLAGLGVLCLLLSATRPDATAVWMLPSALATVAAVLGLHRLTAHPPAAAQPDRRAFVRGV